MLKYVHRHSRFACNTQDCKSSTTTYRHVNHREKINNRSALTILKCASWMLFNASKATVHFSRHAHTHTHKITHAHTHTHWQSDCLDKCCITRGNSASPNLAEREREKVAMRPCPKGTVSHVHSIEENKRWGIKEKKTEKRKGTTCKPCNSHIWKCCCHAVSKWEETTPQDNLLHGREHSDTSWSGLMLLVAAFLLSLRNAGFAPF